MTKTTMSCKERLEAATHHAQQWIACHTIGTITSEGLVESLMRLTDHPELAAAVGYLFYCRDKQMLIEMKRLTPKIEQIFDECECHTNMTVQLSEKPTYGI